MIKQALCDPASHVTQANKSEFHLICCKTLHLVSSPSRGARAFPIPPLRGIFHSFFFSSVLVEIEGKPRISKQTAGRLLDGCSLLCGRSAALHKWDYAANEASQ